MFGGQRVSCPPPLLPDITTAHIIDMYIYLYTEKKEYILVGHPKTLMYIQRTEPTFLFKHVTVTLLI